LSRICGWKPKVINKNSCNKFEIIYFPCQTLYVVCCNHHQADEQQNLSKLDLWLHFFDSAMCRRLKSEDLSAFAAPRLQLTLIHPRNKLHHRISLNEWETIAVNSGKGHNKLLEIANPIVETRVVTNAVQRRVSENRGTHVQHVQHAILASV
jgi:hypothetical protein